MANKKQVLIVTHNMAAFGGGGVEVYQEFLRDMPNWDVSFLFRIKREGKRFWYLQRPDNSIEVYPFPIVLPPLWLRNEEVEETFARILRKNQFNLIHFQHLLWHPLSLPIVAQNVGIPTLYTLHDHFLICSKFNLIGKDGRYCAPFDKPISYCDHCLQSTHKFPHGTQAKRRKFVSRVLQSLSAVISNTGYLSNAVQSIYPGIDSSKFHVIEMLSPPQSAPTLARKRTDQLKIAIPGNFTTVKGAETLLELIALFQTDTSVQFTIMGRIQETHIKEKCAKLKQDKVQFLHGYDSAQTVTILAEHDISLHLTICPESYMITLSEAWKAGVIPIVTRLGAPAERVKNGVNGFVVAPHDTDAVYSILQRLKDDPTLTTQIKTNARSMKTPSVQSHLEELANLYEALIQPA